MPKYRQIAMGVVEATQITESSINTIEAFSAETGKTESIKGEVGDWIVTQGTQIQIMKDDDFKALYHPVDKVIPPIQPTDLNDGEDNPQPWTAWHKEK